jgi:hypothetical protein
MLSKEFGNGPVGTALPPEFGNHFPGRDQFLETLRPAWREFCDRLAD